MILSKLQITDFRPHAERGQADWGNTGKTGETGSLFSPIWQEFIRHFKEGCG